jgi:hypothetical protein
LRTVVIKHASVMNISIAAVNLLHIINVRTNVLKSARKYDIDETLKLKILIDPLK